MGEGVFELGGAPLTVEQVFDFVFSRQKYSAVTLAPRAMEKIRKSEATLQTFLKNGAKIYGVTTGFGDSCQRGVDSSKANELQKNLVNYLLCGTGPSLPIEASRALLLIRLNSMLQGLSGVSAELVERMRLYLEKDWIPIVPCEGSLGASGDLIPMAYLANILQGHGEIFWNGKTEKMERILESEKIPFYSLKPKEALAIVNGTSTMAALAIVNLKLGRALAKNLSLISSWTCLSLQGWREPFSELVNDVARKSPGQSQVANEIRNFLDEEKYQGPSSEQLKGLLLQDRYSLRCAPQILGPIVETLQLIEQWLEIEINSVSDNPLFDAEGRMANGGNFYGGYLSQAMDYLKISLGHMADLMDRQLMTLMDERSNRGLPANLVAQDQLPENERHLHHSLKGLHQSVSAITSEIMAKTIPNGIFSRSSESHNQDKVSLGMSAAVQCNQMMRPVFTVQAMQFICLAQALELRKIELKGKRSSEVFKNIRGSLSMTIKDRPHDQGIRELTEKLMSEALTKEME